MSEQVSITLHGTSDQLDAVVDVLRVAAHASGAVRESLRRADPSIQLLRIGSQDDMRDEVRATIGVIRQLIAAGETGTARCVGVVLSAVGGCDRPPPSNDDIQAWASRLTK